MQLLIKNLTRFFFPVFCPSCSKKLLPDELFICNDCNSKIRSTTAPLLSSEYQKKFSAKGYIKDFYCPIVFEKDKELQRVIHSMKYNKKIKLGYYLGKMTAEKLLLNTAWKIDIIIPVPLHKLKELERGGNQSYFIARGISAGTGIPVSAKYLKRIRYTESQTLKNISERDANMRNAFHSATSGIKNKSLLLVDDVITTGSTVNECARELIKNGAANIYAVSVAITE